MVLQQKKLNPEHEGLMAPHSPGICSRQGSPEMWSSVFGATKTILTEWYTYMKVS